MTKEELMQKLSQKNHAPFLFLGSGFSRHYLDTPDWKGILEKFSPKHINQYYSMLNTDSLPKIAESIAKDLTEDFWNLPDSDPDKQRYTDKINDQSILLKIRISDYLKEKSLIEFPKKYSEEINLLKSLCIDGIITTNWDDAIERMFPKFTKFIGQQELIFAPTYSIGEIYKIHGCFRDPKSLILTESDYKDYNDKNAYLAAKLTTIFIEHPIIFIGYSISDRNIIDLLRSLVCCMDKKNLNKLRDNLFFVDWSTSENKVFQVDNYSISLNNDKVLPVTRIETNSYYDIYECLSKYERSIPANLLREYKKQFYEIVVSDKPERQLYVLPDSKIDADSKIQVVYGFGAISMYKSAIGYTGLNVTDLLRDIIKDEGWDAYQILTKSIPNLRKNGGKNIFLPVYKYLSNIGIKSSVDYSTNQLGINIPLRTLSAFQSYKFPKTDKCLSLKEAIDKYNATVWKVIALIPYLCIKDEELDVLREFISIHFNEFLVKPKSNYSTYMRKLICFYDWRKYGWCYEIGEDTAHESASSIIRK